MKTRLIHLWDTVRTSFWWVPTMVMLAATGLAFVMPYADLYFSESIFKYLGPLAFTPASTQAILTSLAGALITLAGVVYSITIVTLSIASSQYGARILRTFMSDRSTHWAIGIFVGSSLYCLLVLMTVRLGEEHGFAPQLSTGLGVLLAVISLELLIYFIHNVATMIQAPQVVQTVAYDLDAAIDRIFPDVYSDEPHTPIVEESPPAVESMTEEPAGEVRSRHEGYLQAIDVDGLIETAVERSTLFRLCYRPGEFVVRDACLLDVWPADHVDDALRERVNESFITGSRPTPRQDVVCAVNELVEIAMRALSPGINDPFTAVHCVDRLGASLTRLVQRRVPSPYRLDRDKNVRVIFKVETFQGVIDAAFNPIRQYGETSVIVMTRMLEALALIAGRARRQEDRDVIRHHAKMMKRACDRAIAEESDLEDIQRRYERVILDLQREIV